MKTKEISYLPSTGWTGLEEKDWDTSNTLILLFAAPELKSQEGIFDEVVEAFPASTILGCSTAGEIHNTSIKDGSVSGVCMRFEQTQIRLASARINSPSDSKAIGAQIASELYEDDLASVFFLSDGLNVNGTQLAEGFNAVLSNQLPISGGLAGDGSDFSETWIIKNGAVGCSEVAAVGFYGDSVRVGHGSKGGWDIFGLDRKITKSDGNVLFELDGKPALEIYKEYLGEFAANLPASALMFPLELKDDSKGKDVVRTILQVNEEDNSMTFAGDLPVGSEARLMRANFDRLVDGAREAAEEAFIEATDDVAVIAISCVGRRLVLGVRTEDELEEVKDVFPGNTALTGFYSYGEMSPDGHGICDLHNQTMTVTVIGEKK